MSRFFQKDLFSGPEIQSLLEAGVSVAELIEVTERIESNNPRRKESLLWAVRESLPDPDYVLVFATWPEAGSINAIYPDGSGYLYSVAEHSEAEVVEIEDPDKTDPTMPYPRRYYRLDIPAGGNAHFFEKVAALWPKAEEGTRDQ